VSLERWRPASVVLALLCACTTTLPAQTGVSTAVADPLPDAASSPALATPTPEPSFEPAEPAPSPTPVVLPRCAATSPDVIALCLKGARVDVDAAIGEADAAAIAAQVTDDLAAIQAEFQWTIRGSPRIDVYATNERYAIGLMDVFGYPRATADFLVENSVAFFEPSLGRIAVSWEAVRGRRPIAAFRHELTHFVTLEACAPRCDLVPAWLNEGEGRLAEALIPGADWRLMRVRYEAASMVSTDTVIPLAALWTQAQWNRFSDWAGYYKYQEAARATELLRADVGDHAIARVYAHLRAGEDLARAYATLTGRSFDTYLARLSDRLAAEIPKGPAIALSTPGAEGKGASYLLYGFTGEAKVTLRLRTKQLDETQEISVSPQGAFFGTIDDSYPQGTYTITAASGNAVAAVTLTKRGGRSVRKLPGD
jgi:hypothetical protein